MASVSRSTASRSSSSAVPPGGSSSGSVSASTSGVPTSTKARPRKATRSSKASPMGTMTRSSTPCANAPRAMRAAPVFIGARRDRALVVPSGKMAMVPPLARTSWQAANAEVLPAEASRWSTAWSCVR